MRSGLGDWKFDFKRQGSLVGVGHGRSSAGFCVFGCVLTGRLGSLARTRTATTSSQLISTIVQREQCLFASASQRRRIFRDGEFFFI